MRLHQIREACLQLYKQGSLLTSREALYKRESLCPIGGIWESVCKQGSLRIRGRSTYNQGSLHTSGSGYTVQAGGRGLHTSGGVCVKMGDTVYKQGVYIKVQHSAKKQG